MRSSLPLSLRGRSPPCFPLSEYQLNPPQQRWQLVTDTGGFDVLGRLSEHATPEAATGNDDEDATADDDGAEAAAVVSAPLSSSAASLDHESDSASIPFDEDEDGVGVVDATVERPPAADASHSHDALTCLICGPARHMTQRFDESARSGKEEAVSLERSVSLLQMNDLLFLIWDYLPLSQVLHFQHICPLWKELLCLRPGSAEEEERLLAEEAKRQEERDEVGDAEAARRIQREMQHIRDQYERGTRAERTRAAAADGPPAPPLQPLAHVPPLLADFDGLFGRQLAFYRAVTGRLVARDDALHEDVGLRDEVRRMDAEDVAAIAAELSDLDEAEDDAVMAEVGRQGRVRQRERRLDRQHAKRARLTPALVRAMWERTHDRPTGEHGAASSSASIASTATASSSPSLSSRSPPMPLRFRSDDMPVLHTGADAASNDSDDPMLDDELPDEPPTLRRPDFSLSSSSSSSSSSPHPRPTASTASTASFSSSASSSSSSSSSSSFSSSSSSSGSATLSSVDSSALSAWSSRSYLRRLTHAKLSLSPFISPSLSPAIVSSLALLTSVHLYHFPFVRSVFDAEYECVEGEAAEVRQLKEEKEAGERRERQTALAQQKAEKQQAARKQQAADDAARSAKREVERRRRDSGQAGEVDVGWARRMQDAEDRHDAGDAREARGARDGRRTPPARLVAALLRQARLLASHRPPRSETPPLHLLKPLAAQLTTLVYAPSCLTTRDMEQLQALTSLTSLSLHCAMSESGMRSSDQIIPFLSAFPALQSLSLYCQDDGATLPSNFIPHLPLLQPTLTALAVHCSNWKADHIAAIATLANLRSLSLSFTTWPITHAHLSAFAALTSLTSLTLHCGTHLSYALPPSLFALRGLRELAVFGSINVHQSALRLLCELAELRRLRVSNCFDSLNGLVPCVVACSQLRVLDVRGSAMSWRYRERLRSERPDIQVLESGM